MKLYQIAELEQLTGIKAHTLRIWEKRYGLIEPTRTSTNIRRYDDQVKKLLNVATLLGSGYKFSKIAELKEKEVSP
ncbi:MAG: MerR family transcriptional regulator [Sphingobacteriaceae bacterium]|nr:MerR family transcriptional regulator [Sphingobacteriaceae bacterium]